MSLAAAKARHLTLIRLERVAGEAFGCPDEAPLSAGRARFVLPTTFALATFAAALAATITYLV
ncbi:hypothetical protein [Methylobacterium soli]|uniref:Uncharacterized protein n=1 Tax=Methylobacterium soli TaxID=553447 RepID=A0A6L3T1H3_9HYPH|nr:hypothetical protein [Methylobacterium soli]KAB1080430.1 hypothetical protein F6X53_06990 [Methylobacterium soli]GJE41028.1 hypothetical protein AEGHOMDF_0187 [Methylobacterium soli]